ncbi:MAG: hypothetical protein MI924_18720 [Chloroflexales bacterium]|nr:hypothetical protein [Chloroflexales bacterium]
MITSTTARGVLTAEPSRREPPHVGPEAVRARWGACRPVQRTRGSRCAAVLTTPIESTHKCMRCQQSLLSASIPSLTTEASALAERTADHVTCGGVWGAMRRRGEAETRMRGKYAPRSGAVQHYAVRT